MSVEPESAEVRAWRAERRKIDFCLIANAAVSDSGEPTQQQREHAAMARRLLDIEAEREWAASSDNRPVMLDGQPARSADIDMRRRAKSAEALLDKAAAALEFYGDPDTYLAIGFMVDPPCGEFINDVSDIDDYPRPGKLARAVLAEITTASKEGR
jgi:hypothetical protein